MVETDGDAAGLIKAFRNALRKAWEDGRISYDERNIITEFSDGLPISQEKVAELEAREYLRYRWRDYETTPYDIQLSLVEKALELDDENDFLWMKKGSLLYMMGDVEGSLGPLEKSLELDPLSEDAWFWKGVALTSHGDIEGALDCFERAVEQDSDHTLSWVMLSRLERKFGDPEKSKACATRAIESFPEHPMGFIERAATHLFLGKLEEALNDIKMALERDPDNGKALGMRSMIEERMKATPQSKERSPPQEEQGPRRKDGRKRPRVKVELEVEQGAEGEEGPEPAKGQEKSAAPLVKEEELVGSFKRKTAVVVEDETSPPDRIEQEEAAVPKERSSYLDEEMFEDKTDATNVNQQTPIGDGTQEAVEDGEMGAGEEAEEETVEIVYKVIPCPKCGSGVPITTEERPIVVVCPSCGAKGRITK